jgi:hypothetical protein
MRLSQGSPSGTEFEVGMSWEMPARRRFRSYLCIACSKLALHCESATSASIEYILENASQVIVNKLFRISVETVGSYIQDLSENASESAVKYIALNSCGTKIIKSKIPSKSQRLVPLHCSKPLQLNLRVCAVIKDTV